MFVVRLYFYAGQESVRLVHTIVYDGDESRDFIRGLGVVFSVPMREQAHNRHVRFSGDGLGLWSEPIQPMIGRGGRFVAHPQTGVDVYPDQIAGRRVPNKEDYNARGQGLLADWAVWDDFKLVQPNADGFTVLKRANPESAWIPAGAGRRASGLVFAGDVSGGLAASLRNFWQSYPASLEARRASGGDAELIVWMWSPEASGMDMRHYDTRPHGLEAVYEDVQPGFSTAHGVARTSEMTLFVTAAVPSKEETAKWRDKILAGVESLARMPLGLRTGKNLLFGYDPETGKLYQLSDEAGQYNLATIMGGAEVVFELDLMLDDERWRNLWLQYCRLNNAPREVVVKDMTTGTEGNDASYLRDGRLASYVYMKTKNPAFMKVGVNSLLASGRGRGNEAIRRVEGPESLKPVDESGLAGTNGAAQNGLTTIISLGMAGDHLPAKFPPQEATPAGRERGPQRPNQRPPGN